MKPVLMKSTLSLAVVALFAAGCSSTPTYEARNDFQPTLSSVGPLDANGAPAATGANGPTGIVGNLAAQGNTGMAGMGGHGGHGVHGYTGSTGAVGSANPSWNYNFSGNSDLILGSDSDKTQEIVNYMRRNPSSRITLNGPSDRYINSVSDVLKNAGVPANQIQTGVFIDPNLTNDPRVDVLIGN